MVVGIDEEDAERGCRGDRSRPAAGRCVQADLSE